jgi:hypothetical protein
MRAAPLLVPTSLTDAIPGYDAGFGTLHVDVLGDAKSASSACQDVDGAKVVSPDHPEAQLAYMTPAWPPDASTTVFTGTTSPYVFVSGIVGTSATVAVTKAGCSPSTTAAPLHQTGRFPIEKGALTIGYVVL